MSLINSSFESSPLALLITNSELKIISANKKALSLFSRGRLSGLSLLDLFDEDSQLKFYNQQKQLIESKDAPIEVKLCKSIPDKWLELSYQTLHEHPDFLVWGVHDITIYKLREKKLEDLAYYDSLTGAYTRHYFFYLSGLEMSHFHRNKKVFSVLLLDLDDFKLINDTYGHSTGDNVLGEFGSLISKRLRQQDIFGRIGGEEFAIVLSNTSHEEAIYIATRLCHTVEEHFKYCAVTVSVGVASVNDTVKTFDQLMCNADEALYQRKRNGKNGVQARVSR